MKLVTFTRDVGPNSPRKGDEMVIPDLLAELLAANGEIENVRPWPEEPKPANPVHRHLGPHVAKTQRAERTHR